VHIKSERSFFETGESDGAFSMVFSQDALCHAADQTGRALDEAARLLREGGLLAFTNIVVDPQVSVICHTLQHLSYCDKSVRLRGVGDKHAQCLQ
jgi:predicted O-methyltransferase YrrM